MRVVLNKAPNMRSSLMAFLLILYGVSCGFSQNLAIPEDMDKKAVKFYEKGLSSLKEREAMEAIDHFSKALKRSEDFTAARIMRGSVRYNLKDYQQAEKDFLKVLAGDEEFPPKVYFTTGMIQWKLDKFEQAAQNFEQFLKYDDEDERFLQKAKRLYERSLFSAKAVANPLTFNPVSVGDAINTEANEYLPSLTADGKIMLFTRRVGKYEFLYRSKYENGKWQEAESMDIINQYMESGAHAISADGKLIVFTSCERSDGYGSCDLYYTRIFDGRWIPPRNLGQHVNSAAWDSQPTLADNGRTLYFASNRQGTIGKKDLWVTRRLPSGRWSIPRNLGPDINTSGDEKAPFIHFDGSTLYFMSNKHIGMGDFDVFKSTRISDTAWTTPENLGYPINTKFHDGTLSIDILGEKGYITSDRHHEKELRKGELAHSETDIYEFTVPKKIRPNPSTFVVFDISDRKTGDPLEAHIEVIDAKSGKVNFHGIADEEGEMLVVLPLDHDYSVRVSHDGYAFFSERIELEGIYTLDDPFVYDVELWKPGDTEEEPVVLKNILFKTGSAELEAHSYSEIDYLYKLLNENPEIFIEIRGHTDNVGTPEDNQELSLSRARSVKSVLVDKGISESRIKVKGFGESRPLADNDTEEGRRLNRRTEFIIIKP